MKRTAIKKRGKKAVSTRKLDALFWAKIKERDGGQCVWTENGQRCNKTEALAPSHILPKGKYPRLRWELDNALCLCYRHHIHTWHADPILAQEWLEGAYPGRAANLRLLARFAAKVDRAEVLKQLESKARQ